MGVAWGRRVLLFPCSSWDSQPPSASRPMRARVGERGVHILSRFGRRSWAFWRTGKHEGLRGGVSLCTVPSPALLPFLSF